MNDEQNQLTGTEEMTTGTPEETAAEPIAAADDTAPETAEVSVGTEPVETAEAADETDNAATADVADEAEDDPLAGAFQYDTTQPSAEKRRWPIVVLAVLLVAVFVGGLLWAFGAFDSKPDDTDAGGTTDNAEIHALTAAQSANYEVTNGMFAFDMETMYKSFVSNYSYYLSSLQLDTTKSLKEQTAYGQESSWFDYFASRAKEDVQWVLVMAEAAKKNGVTLDAAMKKQIDTFLASTDLSTYHNGVTAEDAAAFLELYYTAMTQENLYYNSLRYSEAEVEKYYQTNSTSFDKCGYTFFAFSIGENGDFATADEAEATVAKLAACTGAEAFQKEVVAFLMSTGQYKTEDEALQAYQTSYVKSGAGYSATDGISNWLFDSATVVGNTKRMQTETTIAVYMLTEAPARDASKTVNVRHILLSASSCGSEEAAQQKANELLAQWRDGEATAASFGELAAQYTEDSNGATGGLYEGVTKGTMVTEFDAWCFDDARVAGDSDVVKTSYGYHVMYFEGAGEAWQTSVVSTMRNADYEAKYAELQSQYPVTFSEENIAKNEL